MIGQWKGKVGLEVLEREKRGRRRGDKEMRRQRKMEEEEVEGRWSRTTWPGEATNSTESHN